MFAEGQRRKKRRRCSERMNRGADVVEKSRKCQFKCARASTNGILSLENENRKPRLLQSNCRTESIRPRANDYRIIIGLVQALHRSKIQKQSKRPLLRNTVELWLKRHFASFYKYLGDTRTVPTLFCRQFRFPFFQ
jgi:hypothetical protein